LKEKGFHLSKAQLKAVSKFPPKDWERLKNVKGIIPKLVQYYSTDYRYEGSWSEGWSSCYGEQNYIDLDTNDNYRGCS
jgi:hypothetical protein